MDEAIDWSDYFDEDLMLDDDEQTKFIMYRHPEWDKSLFVEDDQWAFVTAIDCLGRQAEESEFTVVHGTVSKTAFEDFCNTHEWDG